MRTMTCLTSVIPGFDPDAVGASLSAVPLDDVDVYEADFVDSEHRIVLRMYMLAPYHRTDDARRTAKAWASVHARGMEMDGLHWMGSGADRRAAGLDR